MMDDMMMFESDCVKYDPFMYLSWNITMHTDRMFNFIL